LYFQRYAYVLVRLVLHNFSRVSIVPNYIYILCRTWRKWIWRFLAFFRIPFQYFDVLVWWYGGPIRIFYCIWSHKARNWIFSAFFSFPFILYLEYRKKRLNCFFLKIFFWKKLASQHFSSKNGNESIMVTTTFFHFFAKPRRPKSILDNFKMSIFHFGQRLLGILGKKRDYKFIYRYIILSLLKPSVRFS
jgi:hypothetical protein